MLSTLTLETSNSGPLCDCQGVKCSEDQVNSSLMDYLSSLAVGVGAGFFDGSGSMLKGERSREETTISTSLCQTNRTDDCIKSCGMKFRSRERDFQQVQSKSGVGVASNWQAES